MGRMIAAAYRWKLRTSRTRRARGMSLLIFVLLASVQPTCWPPVYMGTVWSLHSAGARTGQAGEFLLLHPGGCPGS